MKLEKFLGKNNIVDQLDEDTLTSIGDKVVEGYNQDEDSRKEWKRNLETWTKLALQVVDRRTYPWDNASNVKFPIVATAAMQFAARAYPTLVPPDGNIVKCKTVGADPDGEKFKRALRIQKHMSYQIMHEMEEWEEEMDRLLLTLPIAGTVFKKTYFDKAANRNKSELVMPVDLVVNYWAKDLKSCARVTQIHEWNKREVQNRIRSKLFADIDLSDPQVDTTHRTKVNPSGQEAPDNDETTPYIFLEQYCYHDLDKDGYSEPYVVFVELNSRKVARIVPNFDEETVEVGEDGEIVRIDPLHYYTKYDFIPNPDGGFYSIGFGRLLGPINASVDTLINQLIDSGTLSNLQSGFIGKGLRMKMGEAALQPGEWRVVNAMGDDIKKQIFPLPAKEPSQVLFKLLELLIQSSKELASVAEIFVGKMPGQNTPATTTMATIEQGMKLFTAVYKRVYRSLTEEFRKLFLLNQKYLDPQVEIDILDEPVQQSDYKGSEKDVIPAADPTAASQQERQQKAQGVLQLLPLGTINPMAATQMNLEALDVDPSKVMMQPQPQQDPKQQEMQMKAQLEAAKMQHQQELDAMKMKMEMAAEEQKMRMKEELHKMDLQYKQQEAMLKQRIAYFELQQSQAQHVQGMQQQADQAKMDAVKGAMAHSQNMQQSAQAHEQKMKQQPKTETKAKSK